MMKDHLSPTIIRRTSPPADVGSRSEFQGNALIGRERDKFDAAGWNCPGRSDDVGVLDEITSVGEQTQGRRNLPALETLDLGARDTQQGADLPAV